jgi:hypothetical protein
MNATRTKSNHGIFRKCHLLSALLVLWSAGCASFMDSQLAKQFSRVGESETVTNSIGAVTNAIVSWSGTLTNGYVLYGDNDTRLYHTSLKPDPATLFMLRNGTNAIGVWGKSACLPPDKSSFFGDVIIRVLPVDGRNRVSVAIHASHLVRGLVWNFHTFGFEHEKIVELPPCPQDERQVLDEILSKLQTAAAH